MADELLNRTPFSGFKPVPAPNGSMYVVGYNPLEANKANQNARYTLEAIRNFIVAGIPLSPGKWVTQPTITVVDNGDGSVTLEVSAGEADWNGVLVEYAPETYANIALPASPLQQFLAIAAKEDGTLERKNGSQSQNPETPAISTGALLVNYVLLTSEGGNVEQPPQTGITESRVLELLAESFVDTVENGNMKGVTSNAVYNHPLFEEWVNNVHYPPDYPRVLTVQLAFGTHLLFKRTSKPLAESPAFPGTGTYIHPVEEDTQRQYYSIFTPRSVQPFPAQGGAVADSTILYEGSLVALQLNQTSYSSGMTLQAAINASPSGYVVLSGNGGGSATPSAPVALTDAANLTVDLALSDKFTLQKGNFDTQLAFSNPKDGKEFALIIKGANGKKITFPAGYTHYVATSPAGSVTLPASGNAILIGMIEGESVWWALEAAGGTGPTLGTGPLAVSSGAMTVPMTSDGVYYATSYPTSITVDTTNNSLGRGVVCKVVANGTTAPTVAGATKHNSSANFNTTNGMANTLRVWCEYNASNVKTNYYIWTQQ